MRVGISLLGVTHNMGGNFQYATTMLDELSTVIAHDKLVVFVDDLPALCAESVRLPAAHYVEVPAEADSRIRTVVRFLMGRFNLKTRNAWVRGRYASLDRQNCDVIFHPYWSFGPVVGYTAAIAAILDCAPRVSPEIMRWGPRRALDQLIIAIARCADVVLTESELTRRHLAVHYGVDPAKVVAIPLKPPRYLFAAEARSRGEVLEHYGLAPGYLFMPGRFGSYHNTERVLTAVRSLLDRDPSRDVRVLLVGVRDGEMEAARTCIIRLALHANVRLMGFVPDEDMSALYSAAVAMPFPSLLGPSSIPLCEAMALGCPVLVSTIDGHEDLVGDAGLFVDPLDTEAIAAGLARLLSDQAFRAELSARGLRRFEEMRRFDHAGTLRRLAQEVSETRKTAG